MSEDEEINVMDDGDEVLSMQEAQEVILADEKTHAIPLNQIFEGDTLLQLEDLGVETFNASELEQDVLEEMSKKYDEMKSKKTRKRITLKTSNAPGKQTAPTASAIDSSSLLSLGGRRVMEQAEALSVHDMNMSKGLETPFGTFLGEDIEIRLGENEDDEDSLESVGSSKGEKQDTHDALIRMVASGEDDSSGEVHEIIQSVNNNNSNNSNSVSGRQSITGKKLSEKELLNLSFSSDYEDNEAIDGSDSEDSANGQESDNFRRLMAKHNRPVRKAKQSGAVANQKKILSRKKDQDVIELSSDDDEDERALPVVKAVQRPPTAGRSTMNSRATAVSAISNNNNSNNNSVSANAGDSVKNVRRPIFREDQFDDDEMEKEMELEGLEGDNEIGMSDDDENDDERDSDEEGGEDQDEPVVDGRRLRRVQIPGSAVKKSKAKTPKDNLNLLYKDDGDDAAYEKRMQFASQIRRHEQEEFVQFDSGAYKIASALYNQLFDHQKTGVRWLWELHQQSTGGILADEMGLGKTITVASFLAGLHSSHQLHGPTLILCPASILAQWVHELHLWAPAFRVMILHSSGSHGGTASQLLRKARYQHNLNQPNQQNQPHVTHVIVVTTYESMKKNVFYLKQCQWQYLILDEGHKLRNPDAAVTQTCKQFPTPHRLIVTGEPIQNNLTELWSIFDFVFPGKLGTLPAFQKQFADPIARGGYASASAMEVQTAYQCALILRNLIAPFFLRRMKKNVNIILPAKMEQILFCHLTDTQVMSYKTFLQSNECKSIYEGNLKCLYGITILRKICNHTLLLQKAERLRVSLMNATETKEMVEQSGKLKVLQQILPLWQKQGHKVLIFSQTIQMLNILEQFIAMSGYDYRRMDGNTLIKTRANMIKEFNEKKEIFVFLLTTKVGGIGVNLTGASRVVIYDPDWNPSTDAQARERTWRIGQKKDVTVYRLLAKGTIEEKIYHRQIWKQFLTGKVLGSQLQQTRSVFELRGLKELFCLENRGEVTDTLKMFEEVQKSKKEVKDREERLKKRGRQGPDAADAQTTEGTPDKKKKKRSNEDGVSDETDSVLLKSIIGNTLSDMIDHDALVGWEGKGGRGVTKDAQALAEKMAQKLKESRDQLRGTPLSHPTWTGKQGMAGVPREKTLPKPASNGATQKKKFGNVSNPRILPFLSQSAPSTALATPTALPAMVSNATQSRSNSSVKNVIGIERPHLQNQASMLSSQIVFQAQPDSDLLASIHSFLLDQGGACQSTDLIQHFQKRILPQQQDLFKKLLREIARLDKEERTWVLKDEFQ